MIIVYSRAPSDVVALPGLGWQIDPSVASKIYHTVQGGDPHWLGLATDGQTARGVRTIVPDGGVGTDLPLWDEGLDSVAPLWEQSAPALPNADLLFDGVDDRCLIGNSNGNLVIQIGTLLDASAKTAFVALQIHSASLNDPTFPQLNHPIFYDAVKSFGGILVRNDGGTYKLQFWNYDGSTDFVEIPISLDTNYVACLRHDGTTLYGSINGGTESSTASGASVGVNNTVRFGGDGARFTNMSLGEVLFYNINMTGTDFTHTMNYMLNKWL
jgi:hypothetical protein